MGSSCAGRKPGWRVGKTSVRMVGAKGCSARAVDGSKSGGNAVDTAGRESSSLAYRTVDWRKIKPADQ